MSLPPSTETRVMELESLWLQHTDVIHRLYISENKTLRQVKHAMESEHEFPILRLHDYEVALRELLKLRKNLKKRDWYSIGKHMSIRKKQGKESQVLWHNIPLAARKVRKEVLRNRNVIPLRHRKTINLPGGLIISTPPMSPGRELNITEPPSGLLPISESARTEPSDEDSRTISVNESVLDVQVAPQLRDAAQRGISVFRHLREDVPFNRFILQMLDDSKSQPLLILASAQPALTPSPRLFGCNPSWEILAQATFELSNKLWIDWRTDRASWFLDWLGLYADLAVLGKFFSAKTPTVWAVYEALCRLASTLRKPGPARILFEIQSIVASNNPAVIRGFQFLKMAVHIGSNADGMLDLARRSSERFELSCNLQILLLAAAARRDMAMMRHLVGAVARFDDKTYHADEATIRLLFSVMRQLYGWNPQDPEEVNIIAGYVELLIEGGILTTGLAARCCYDDRPKVEVWYPATITIDELVMLSPPTKRASLYALVTQWSNEHRSFVSKAGVFTAALSGVRSLKAYLNLCNQNDCFEIRVTLQESLLFAACLDDINTVSVLLQIGVDPGVELLSKNQERYHKGDMPWNPMLVAAVAGNLEILDLLSKKIKLDDFLRVAPIHEIVQVENALNNYGHILGRELRRMENLRRHYLHRQNHNSDRDVSHAMLYMHSCQKSHEPCAPQPNMNMMVVGASFFTIVNRRLETLSWIRKAATAHNARQRIDQEIIKAALFSDPETRALKCRGTSYQSCDVLLLEGLVDENAGYHQDEMDLLQLSIRAQCSLKVVQFLLNQGFRVHSRPNVQSAKTMLHDAILSNSSDRSKIVELLLKQGAEYKHCGKGLTILEACLHRKCFSMEQGPFPEDVELFKRLFEAGAPVRDQPRRELERWSPMICLLLRLGAADDLVLRVVDAGAVLCERGWDNCMASDNNTPLQEAISRGRETLAREFIQRGADVNAPADRMFGSTALQAACKFRCSFQFVEYLIKVQRANINEAPGDIGGWTALQGAALRGSLSMAELLLAHGADVNGFSGRFGPLGAHQGLQRRRALDVAAMMGRLDMTVFLLKAGGRSCSAGLGGAIYIAKENRHYAVLSVLLDWEKEHGSRLLEEEAEWQQQNPDSARTLLGSWSDDDFSDESDEDRSVEGDFDE